MFWLVHSTPVINSCSESPHLESLNQCKGQRKEYFLILHSYLMHFLQSFISLLQSISYLKLNLSKLNILYLLYNDHSLSLTWIFYFMMGQVPRGRKVFLQPLWLGVKGGKTVLHTFGIWWMCNKPGGIHPSNSLVGMRHWMRSHFLDWIHWSY